MERLGRQSGAVRVMSGKSDKSDKYDVLMLKSQLCFPLYVCAKEVVKAYTPYLEKLGITYTQYITMMVMWEHKELRVKEIGEYLYLDSGTLTSVLKKLEEKGFVTRRRSEKDERELVVTITESGEELRDKAVDIPNQLSSCVDLEPQKVKELYDLLYEVIGKLIK